MLTHNSNILIEWEHNKITKYPIGVQLKCHIFVYNISQNCPEQIDTYYTQEVVLRQSDFDQPEQLKTLLSESWNAPILDSGATNTVAGESWFVCYMSSLSEDENQKVQCHLVNSTYRYGNGKFFFYCKM